MGYGADGVVVLVNVPIWVGVAEQHAQQGSGPGTVTFDPAVAEARLLELVNDARQRAGVPPLPADPELRAVALAHSQDMAQHGFIGHVSPSTGRVDDRVLRAGVRVSVMGENVASHTTPETCHDFLMGSPGHRANILRRDFTHVGIGVVIHPGAGEPQVYATQVFGRRPAPSEVRPTAEAIVEAIHHFRQARGLQAASTDPVLSAAAAAGVRAYVASMPRSHQRAAQAVSASIDAHVNRTRQGRPASCIMLVELLERAQLVVTPSILDRNLRRFGVAVDVLEQHETPRSAVMLVLEGTDKGPVVCH
jgi:uncharacterized protein YkwD